MGLYIKGATRSQLMKALICSTEFLGDDLEIVEVKEPHGDLIDIDTVLAFDIFDEEHRQEDMTIRESLALWAEQMPQAVIEAEGE